VCQLWTIAVQRGLLTYVYYCFVVASWYRVSETMDPNSKDRFQLLPNHVADEEVPIVVVVSTTKTTTTPNYTSGKPFFRSNCHPDDIPDVARGMIWHDSFYENDTDVLAVWDMDRTLSDRHSCYSANLILLGSAFLIALLAHILSPSYIGIILIFPVAIFLPEYITVERVQNCMRRRTHVAVTRQGIYFDRVNGPAGQTHMSRTVIPYDQIGNNRVNIEKGFCNRCNKVVVYTKDGEPALQLMGVVQKQKEFADIVNAMIERSQHLDESTTNNEVPGGIKTIQIQPTNEEKITLSAAKCV
jgi:hypothetical protein